MSHRYETDDGKPLLYCPFCALPLTAGFGVLIAYRAGSGNGQADELSSYLDLNGTLIDVDNVVKNGYHVDTCCWHCNESLANHEAI